MGAEGVARSARVRGAADASSAARVSFASRARRGLTEAGRTSWSRRGGRRTQHTGRQRGRGWGLPQRAFRARRELTEAARGSLLPEQSVSDAT